MKLHKIGLPAIVLLASLFLLSIVTPPIVTQNGNTASSVKEAQLSAESEIPLENISVDDAADIMVRVTGYQKEIEKLAYSHQTNGVGTVSGQQLPVDQGLDQYKIDYQSAKEGNASIVLSCEVTYLDGSTQTLSKTLSFTVKPAGKVLLQFGVMSDVHIGTNNANARLNTALQNFQKLMPNANLLLFNGDMTNRGTPYQYAVFKKILSGNGVGLSDCMFSMGNHEYFADARPTNTTYTYTDQDYVNRFINNFDLDKLYYKKEINGYTFISLSGEKSRITNQDYRDSAILSQEQIAFLQSALEEASASGKPIFVMLHQPLTDTVYGSSEALMQQSETDIEKQLKKLLAQYPQVVLFSSHTHFLTEHPRSFYQTGFTMVNTGSVGDPWYEGGEVKNRSESLFVYVYDNRIVIKGYDHENSRWVSQYTVSLPYTARAAKGSAPVFTSNDLQVDRWSQNAADVTFTSPVSAYGIDKYEVYVDGKLAATEYIRYWENAKPSESVTVRVGGLTKGQHTISVKAYDLYLTPSKSVEQSVQIGSE